MDCIGEVGHNGKLYRFVDVIMIIIIVGRPHGVSLIASFVGLQLAEDRLIKNYKNLYVILHYYGARRKNT